jgi:PhzF family phenazine biosynthesis protein
MEKYRAYQVDSFTRQKFAGNPAGVISNADGLTEEQMQKIAREFNNSETAFVHSPTGADHDYHVRFFTPTKEVPICGHATVAAHYVIAKETGARLKRVLQKTGVGILPVDILEDDSDYRIVMTQGKIEFGDVIDDQTKEALLAALHIQAEDVDSRCPIQIASTGHSKVMIGIRSRAMLNSLSPDLAGLAALSSKIGCNGYFVFTFDSDDSAVLTHGRMFAPAIGINEDPVTGNANGPLGAYLVHHRIVPHDGKMLVFTGQQGEAISRTGRMEVRTMIENNEPTQVQIVGEAVIAFETEIEI